MAVQKKEEGIEKGEGEGKGREDEEWGVKQKEAWGVV